MALFQSVTARGKRLLMESALRLAARSRSLQAVSLREVAREAGLNPNTFYRHFKTIDDVGLAIAQYAAEQLRQPLRDLRRHAASSAGERGAPIPVTLELKELDLRRGRLAARETVRMFFEFVLQHPDAFTLGVRELHGASPVLRNELDRIMNEFARDMAEDTRELGLMPRLNDNAIDEISDLVIRHLFQVSLDYIEHPERREAILEQGETLILRLFVGALALQALPAEMRELREPGAL